MEDPMENPEKRAWPAIGNGLLCRCPKCGKGKLYPRFIEQTQQCEVCGEPLGRYNVGLLLPFVMIMIVAHVLVAVMLDLELRGGGGAGFYLSVMVPLAVVVPLVLLRPVKGAIIGFLWARGLSDELDE
jgi:uncharacterized protein (DUF983 family)